MFWRRVSRRSRGAWWAGAAPARGLAFAPQQARLPRFPTAAAMYDDMRALTAAGGGGEYTVRNYLGVIEDLSSPDRAVVETELFPRGALDYYTAKNMGWPVSDADTAAWQMNERGGAQGDYRDGMQAKIANAIDCLRTHPDSKRATIPIPFATEGSSTVDWRDAGQTKCCRELCVRAGWGRGAGLWAGRQAREATVAAARRQQSRPRARLAPWRYLYIEEDKLCCSAVLRMQNASIFPKVWRAWPAIAPALHASGSGRAPFFLAQHGTMHSTAVVALHVCVAEHTLLCHSSGARRLRPGRCWGHWRGGIHTFHCKLVPRPERINC